RARLARRELEGDHAPAAPLRRSRGDPTRCHADRRAHVARSAARRATARGAPGSRQISSWVLPAARLIASLEPPPSVIRGRYTQGRRRCRLTISPIALRTGAVGGDPGRERGDELVVGQRRRGALAAGGPAPEHE